MVFIGYFVVQFNYFMVEEARQKKSGARMQEPRQKAGRKKKRVCIHFFGLGSWLLILGSSYLDSILYPGPPDLTLSQFGRPIYELLFQGAQW